MSKLSITRRSTARLAWLLMSALLLPACSAATPPNTPPTTSPSTPEPEIYPIEPVRLNVTYAGREDEGRGQGAGCKISVFPETVNIFFQYDQKRFDRTKDTEVLWKVDGLRRDHTVFIVAKRGVPTGVFNAPKEYGQREAFYIDGANNAIRSGLVTASPENLKQMRDGHVIIHWKYEVVVVDGKGKELCSIDPQVVVAGHP